MTPLERQIRRTIETTGPVTVAEFMALALAHPEHGYYMGRDPLGARGDFVTAPEISQVFGELIGLWAAVAWEQCGSPGRVVLAECGPGRGTLMADALRAAAMVPAFADAIEVHLVETSPALRARQAETLAGAAPAWHDTVGGLPDAPLILIANEFFDALPVRQFVKTAQGWAERCVGLADGELAFVAGADIPPAAVPAVAAAEGDIVETCPAAQAVAAEIGARIAARGGAALIVDYGHAVTAAGDTLQAVRGHDHVPPLCDPGDCDLTAHVDFAALADGFREGGACPFGPVTQGALLEALGIRERTERLAAGAAPDAASLIRSATNRLIDADQMGTLFKALAVAAEHAPPPAGFEG